MYEKKGLPGPEFLLFLILYSHCDAAKSMTKHPSRNVKTQIQLEQEQVQVCSVKF